MGAADLDLQLVRRVQQGERQAFDLLVLKYQHKVIHLVTRYARDAAEAQDIAQEAFIKAYRALPNFRGDSAFYTWLYRIAINTAKNFLVAHDRRPPDSDIDVGDAEQFEGVMHLKEFDTPEALAISAEVQQTLHRAVEELPEDLRTAILLRELEGLSYEEIAQAMECPVGTVRSRIFRARAAIDQSLKEVHFPGAKGLQ